MAIERTFFLVLVCACNSATAPQQNVTIAPAGSTPSANDADASDDASTAIPYASDARTRFTAAEALAGQGHLVEARAAFTEMIRLFPYSKLARDAELRIAELDEKSGDHAKATEEFRTWAHNHPSDERAAAIRARADTIGDVTCRTDADCAVTTKQSCCECCPSGHYATSRAWLTWRDGQCASTRCEPCAKKCAPEAASATAVCRASVCVLAP